MKNQKQPTGRQTFQKKFGKPIEDFDSVKRSVESIRRVTAQTYYRVLPNYFLFLDENPDRVIENRRRDIGSENYEQAEAYERKTMAFANMLLLKGQSGRGVQGVVGRCQGFFANNSKRYSLDLRKLKLPKARKVQKYSPSNEEVRHLYAMADSSRDKLLVALAYQNGLNPMDLSLLNVGDLPSEDWAYFEKSRSKTGEVYRGAVTPDVSYELKTYLKIRGNPSKGPLFRGRFGALDNQAISAILSELIQRSGFKFRPTSLRDALEDALVSANVNRKLKETIMGHSGNIEMEYGGANVLMVNVVEAMKKAYPLLTLNGLSRISTQQGGVSKEEFEALKAESQVQLSQKDKEIGELRQSFEELRAYTMKLSAAVYKRELPFTSTESIEGEKSEKAKSK